MGVKGEGRGKGATRAGKRVDVVLGGGPFTMLGHQHREQLMGGAYTGRSGHLRNGAP